MLRKLTSCVVGLSAYFTGHVFLDSMAESPVGTSFTSGGENIVTQTTFQFYLRMKLLPMAAQVMIVGKYLIAASCQTAYQTNCYVYLYKCISFFLTYLNPCRKSGLIGIFCLSSS